MRTFDCNCRHKQSHDTQTCNLASDSLVDGTPVVFRAWRKVTPAVSIYVDRSDNIFEAILALQVSTYHVFRRARMKHHNEGGRFRRMAPVLSRLRVCWENYGSIAKTTSLPRHWAWPQARICDP